MEGISTSIKLIDDITGPLNRIIGNIQNFSNVMKTVENSNINVNADKLNGVFEEIISDSARIITLQNELKSSINENTDAAAKMADVFKKVETPKIHTVGDFEWNVKNNSKVFTDFGIERNKKELEDLNNMLHKMSGFEVVGAFKVNDDATQSINSINSRIEKLKVDIEKMANSPLIGDIEDKNAMLEKTRRQVSKILEVQNELNSSINRMDTISAQRHYMNLNNIVDDVERDIINNIAAQNEFNKSLKNGEKNSDNFLSKIKMMVGAYVGIKSLKTGIELSDNIVNTKARLNLMNDGKQSTEELQKMIFDSAQRSGGDFIETMGSISKMGLMAGDAFSSNAELVNFMELINKEFKISGTDPQGISAAMLQLTQAMGAGALRGEELNSVLEQAPLIVHNIAEYLGEPVGKIKDLAADGVITASVVKNAMFAASEKINSQFESIPLTFGTAMTKLKNEVISSFTPISKNLSSILNSNGFRRFLNEVTFTINKTMILLNSGLEMFVGVAKIVADNWGVIKPVLGTIIGLVGAYTGAVLFSGVANGISSIATLANAAATVVLGKATDAATIETHKQTLAQWGLNAAILANPAVLIIGGIIAALYIGTAVFNKFAGTSYSATAIIIGAFNTLLNAIKSQLNYTISAIEIVINFLISTGEMVANIFKGNFFKTIANYIIDVVDLALKALGTLAKSMDKLFGTNTASYLENFGEKLNKFQDEKIGENEVTFERVDFSKFLFETKTTKEAFRSGYDGFNNFNLEKESFFNGLANNLGIGMDKSTSKNDDIGKIKKNTDKMVDKLDISVDEIKYMRDIAEMEVVNKLTTAKIKVDVGGVTNQVNSGVDFENFYQLIGSKLEETVNMAIEGVY